MTSAERATYLDASALVKLVVAEPESVALRRYLRGKRPLLTSALSRAEVPRALISLGPIALRRGQEVLAGVEVIRLTDRVLAAAASLLPREIRTLDAIHLATALQIGSHLARIVTYDDRMAAVAGIHGLTVAAPF